MKLVEQGEAIPFVQHSKRTVESPRACPPPNKWERVITATAIV